MDDVLIWGATQAQHDERLRAAMDRLRTAGITLNKPKLQRMRMHLMRYMYDVVYVPGRRLTVVDVLSRSPLPQTESIELENEIQGYLRLVASSVPVTTPSLQLIAREQKQDPVGQALINLCTKGWPSRLDVGFDLKPYWNERQNIALVENLLMCGSR